MHEGFTLAIVGRPNVGKSSLFNRLLEQDRAIVTDIPGTTRDLVSETASIDGIPVKFVDTAGIRAGQDVVETLGIERSYQAMADADLTLVVVDLSAPLDAEDRQLIERRSSRARASGRRKQVRSCQRARTSAARCPFPRSPAKGSRNCAAPSSKPIAPRGRLEQEGGFITSLRHEQLLQETSRGAGAGAHRDDARHPA